MKHTIGDYEVEKGALTGQLNAERSIIKDSELAIRLLIEALNAFERRLKEMSVVLNWPKFSVSRKKSRLHTHFRKFIKTQSKKNKT